MGPLDLARLPLATEAGWPRAAPTEGGVRRPYLAFRLEGDEYAVELLRLREILKARPITEVPRVPEFVAGVISVRGQVMPVIDMKRRLGLTSTRPAARLLVVGRSDERFALLVDQVIGVTPLSDDEIEPRASRRREGEHVLALGRPAERRDRLLLLLDLDGILEFDVRACGPPARRPGEER